MLLCIPTHTHERRLYSATLYPTNFNLDPLLVLVIRGQGKPHGWCFISGPMASGSFSCDCTFYDERGEGFTRQPVGPLADTSTMTTVMSTNRVDSWRFSSRCCAYRRTHTSVNTIRLLSLVARVV